MPPNSSSTPVPPPIPASSAPAARKGRWLLYGCGTVIALVLLMVATVWLTLWWIQRPIKPVVLSAQEKAAVEEKLQRVGGDPSSAAGRNRPASGGTSPTVAKAGVGAIPEPDRPYVPGSKVLKLTEREINGLLNANTDLGKSVRIEFARDAINAYLAVPIPADFPVLGGKMFRARGRFSLSVDQDATPYAILEDVTIFGLSFPKAWLAGVKGENLLDRAMGRRNGKPVFRGIKSLHVEPGALVLEVED